MSSLNGQIQSNCIHETSFSSREPRFFLERSSIGSSPGPMEQGEDTPKFATDQELDSQANSNVLNRVAWAGGWQFKPRGSRAPQRCKSRLLPSQSLVYPPLLLGLHLLGTLHRCVFWTSPIYKRCKFLRRA